MTDDRQTEIDRIDQARREREDALLALLLALMAQSRSHAVHAARSGYDAAQAARNPILGDSGGHFIGMPPVLTAGWLDAYEDGRAIAGTMTGEEVPPMEPGELAEIERAFRRGAQEYAETLADKISDGVKRAQVTAKTPGDELAAIRKVYIDNQVTRLHPGHLAAGVEAQVISAHNGGIVSGAKKLPMLWGFEHVSVVDEATTPICLCRAGLKLPKDHPYWRGRNFPSLHFGCRSFIRVLLYSDNPVESDWLPDIPAAPGFGYLPLLGYLPVSGPYQYA